MTVDYPEAAIMKKIKILGDEIAKTNTRTANLPETRRYLDDGERLIMSDHHKLAPVYQVLIEDPAFRTAIVAIISGIVPEAFMQMSDEQLIMMITYITATAIAATED